MATVTVRRPEPTAQPPTTVILEMTLEEAQRLSDFLGDTDYDERKSTIFNNLADALQELRGE